MSRRIQGGLPPIHPPDSDTTKQCVTKQCVTKQWRNGLRSAVPGDHNIKGVRITNDSADTKDNGIVNTRLYFVDNVASLL